MPKIHAGIALLCAATAMPVLAQARSGMPGWQDLEDDYARDGSVGGARQQLAAAIPTGTPAAQAIAALVQAGATCKSMRHAPAAERCLLHQYSLADGAADDIRWTVLIDRSGDRVRNVSLERYVDRHGSN